MTTTLTNAKIQDFNQKFDEQTEITQTAIGQSETIREALERATEDFSNETKRIKAHYEKAISERDCAIKCLVTTIFILMGSSAFIAYKLSQVKC